LRGTTPVCGRAVGVCVVVVPMAEPRDLVVVMGAPR
jgi:hypothetical protein